MAVISISGNNYDSYVSQDEANIYLQARIGQTEWNAASFTVKNQAIVTATRWIERILQRQVSDESLIPDPADDPGTPAPDLIKDATSEAAYALIVDSSIQDQQFATGDNNKVLQAGSAKIERFRPVTGTALPTVVQQLVNEWMSDVGASSVTVGLASGVDGTTSFAEVDQFGVVEGFK